MRRERAVVLGIVLAVSAAALDGCSDAGVASPACGPVPISPPAGLCDGSVALGSAIPADMALDPADLDDATARRMVDCFAWESFAALSWPASAQCRGTPSEARGAATDWTTERVWETYAEPYELFQATDTTWDPAGVSFDQPPAAGACGDLAAANKVLRRTAKFPLGEQLASEDSQAFLPGANLTDQHGNVVWYEITINRDVFDYVRDAGLARTGAYSFAGPGPGLPPVSLPTAANGASGAGTIEIKAAWREMTSDDDLSRYYTQQAVTYDGSECDVKTVGLVGLHVARKVPSSPKWIWATFEHEDNVPDAGTNGDGRDYNFFSRACAEDPPDDCAQQVAIVAVDDVCCANLITFPSPQSSINQVTRLEPIAETREVGDAFREAFARVGSPFRHFVLVGAQWARPRGERPAAWQRPCNPNGPWAVPPPAPGTPCYEQTPDVLRNTSMETLFVQRDAEGVQKSTDSCMNCHFAGGVDGSYLWHDAMINPYPLSGD